MCWIADDCRFVVGNEHHPIYDVLERLLKTICLEKIIHADQIVSSSCSAHSNTLVNAFVATL
jgi:hypothetical protein